MPPVVDGAVFRSGNVAIRSIGPGPVHQIVQPPSTGMFWPVT
jgi:hypothetical protein